ncbi:hypothetical protein VNO78_26996 [Psophocarpus tetragonolobus]|uniref:Protein ENHANCED DISEASE RESISTANCE 2 C-terminal domain-containing protein n=1 Tax=Psophocarpus tetragonolobus TaxID=3891 RepID=A0AAN9S0K2_PSOTE
METDINSKASSDNLFLLCSPNYLTKRQKYLVSDYLLSPTGTDWLKSPSKLDNILTQVMVKSLKSFIFVVNLHVLGKEHHNIVFSLLNRQTNDAFKPSLSCVLPSTTSPAS